MKIILRYLLFVYFSVFFPFLLFAPPGGSWNPGNTDPTVPIGSGWLILALSGVIYGIVRNRKKKQ